MRERRVGCYGVAYLVDVKHWLDDPDRSQQPTAVGWLAWAEDHY